MMDTNTCSPYADIKACLTMEQAMARIYPGIKTYDTALPQEWLNKWTGEDCETIFAGTCWGYPPGSIFGIPCPVTARAAELLGESARASVRYRRRLLIGMGSEDHE